MTLTSSNPPPFAFDQVLLEKVINNLLSNAFKSMDGAGAVDVALTHDQNHVRLTCGDTGRGIPAARLPHIFERYNRGEAIGSGSGIGLALTCNVFTAHGGAVTATSPPGQGAQFVVELPRHSGFEPGRVEETAGVGDDPKSPVEPPAPDGQTTVLIVEDHADVRRYLAQILATDFYILEAPDGISGLDLAQSLIPDLIVSDIKMPGMDGLQFCQALRDHEKTNHIPLILLTANASEQNRLQCLADGADAFMAKPFNASELRIRARALIHMRRLLRQKQEPQGTPADTPDPMPAMDRAFLNKLDQILADHLGEAGFGVLRTGRCRRLQPPPTPTQTESADGPDPGRVHAQLSPGPRRRHAGGRRRQRLPNCGRRGLCQCSVFLRQIH